MNKKIVFYSERKGIFHCILSNEKDFDAQLNRLLYGEEHPRHGICVRFNGDTLDFVDYFHDEQMASHQVVRIEDTDEAVSTTFFNQDPKQ